jgi:hypothetical protein
MPKVPREVIAEQYQLRATFFSNKLDTQQYTGLFEFARANLASLDSSLDWTNCTSFGIDAKIIKAIKDQGLDVASHLCHPNVLLLNHRYLTYFRCISVLSQKGLKELSGVSSVERIEVGKTVCKPAQAERIAITVNENLQAIYASSIPDSEKAKGLMYANAGSSIEGSWKNKIGSEGERIIRTLFLQELLSNGELLKLVTKTGNEVDADRVDSRWLEENTANLQSVITKNAAIVQFGSEPDMKLISSTAKVVAGVEIKAGIDPAGALERLGATMKSFENIRAESSDAETILVMSCITDEVQRRLNGMKNARIFVMTDVIQNKKGEGTRLMNILRACIGLTGSYH